MCRKSVGCVTVLVTVRLMTAARIVMGADVKSKSLFALLFYILVYYLNKTIFYFSYYGLLWMWFGVWCLSAVVHVAAPALPSVAPAMERDSCSSSSTSLLNGMIYVI